ncbi:MAG: class IV adenylate cyclase [Phycisphaerae bacterium]
MPEPQLETEAKFRFDDFAALRDRLRAIGAAYVGRVVERNRFFDRPDESLRRAGYGLRVRSVTILDGPARPPTITFKGPLKPGPLKQRPECELEMADADRAAELLANLGFVECFLFEKRRESWRIGDCLVELDELPRIGRFVEIEGPTVANIAGLQSALGCGDLPIERASYLALLLAAGPITGPVTFAVAATAERQST